MRPLSAVQAGGAGSVRYGRRVRRPVLLATIVLFPLAVLPRWTTLERRPVPSGQLSVTAERVPLDARDPARRRVGCLDYLGGVALTGSDRTSGGFSALAVRGDRFTMIGDGGQVLRFRMGADWTPRDVMFEDLPGGPASGWEKRHRDAESLAIDPATDRAWVGYEGYNQICRAVRARLRSRRPRHRAGGDAGLERQWRDRVVRSSGGWPFRRDLGITAARSGSTAADGAGLAGRSDADPAGVPIRLCPDQRSRRSVGHDPIARWPPADRGAGVHIALFMVAPRRNRGSAGDSASSARAGAADRRPCSAAHHGQFRRRRRPAGDSTVVWLVSDDNHLPIQRTLLLKFRLTC